MKNSNRIPVILLYLCASVLSFFTSNYLKAQQVVKVGAGEYLTVYLMSDKTVKVSNQSTITPILSTYSGLDSIIDVQGGQYHVTALDQQGKVYKLGNTAGYVMTTVDEFGSAFTGNFQVKGFWQCNVSLRGTDSSLWYWGIADPMNYYAGATIAAPKKLLMPSGKKFKKVETGAFSSLSSSYILALATDGSVWRYDRNNPTPYQINISGQTVIDICTLGGAAQVLLTAGNKLFAAGVLSTYAGTASNTTTFTDVTAAWTSKGMTFPIKELVGNSSTLHIIDANNNMFGSGTNVQGEVGTGVEYSPYRIAGPQGGVFGYGFTNGVLLTPPTQIQGKFKNLNTSTTITFYLYVQDMGNNWYSWGRNKGFSLGNGKSAGPYAGWGGSGDYASYPNAMDVPMPKRVNPATLTWVLQSFDPNANIPPVVGAGINQYLSSVSSTTLYGKAFQQEQTIASNTWTKVSGPAGGTITNTGSLNTTITGLSNGTYVYRLSATNSNGQTSTDDVSIIVSSVTAPPTNMAPTVNAGTDKTITLPISTTTLNGTAGDADGTISNYFWTKISGPTGGTITTNTTASTGIAALQAGMYTFSLTVTDNAGATAKDTVQVTVNAANQAPTANAGNNISITLPVITTALTGLGTDADGTIASYAWTKISGPVAGTLTNATTTIATAASLVQGVYSYQLTVTDNAGAIGKDTVNVTVNAAINIAPIVNAGLDANITLPINSSTLSGAGTDADGTIASYAWAKISGPAAGTLTNATTTIATAASLVQGVYSYQLTVTDNAGAIGKDTVNVTVNAAINIAPIVNAGLDANITLPINSSTLSGAGTDADGTIASYAWAKISGPAAGTLTNTNLANATAANLVQGVYSYQLTVTDNAGAIDKDTVNVTVNAAINTAPIVNAGLDANITLPTNSSILSGAGTDADGTIASYAWVKISGPAAGTLTNANLANATAASLVQGVYSYRLTVTDNAGAIGRDTVKVTVNAAINLAPTVNAGLDANITLPTNSSTLRGSGTDADGTIATYAWVKISGPTTGTLTNANKAIATAAGLVQGVYSYQLTVTDNAGATSRDTVNVNVNTATITLLPAINPTNTVNGIDYKYYEGNWSVLPAFDRLTPVKTGFTNNFNISLANKTTQFGFSFTGYINVPADGQYKFYTSSDDGSNLYIDNVLTVSNDGLHATVEKSGLIGLKAGKHTITGLFFQQGGGKVFIVSYEGMGITKQVVPATSLFRVNATPVSNAGADKALTLPTNSTILTGSGTDTDGTIAAYQWSLVSGPSGSALLTAATETCSVSFTNSGTYIFKLTVTDNNGSSATDNVQVIVQPALLISKALKVNLDNGTAPYVNPQWNNWIPVANVNSSNFKYEDGTQSSIFVNIPQGGSFSDNGVNYAATVTNCPPAVLRITSMHTITRIFTVNGLNPTKQYGFEFYGSRAFTSGSKSVFKTGNVADTIDTDFNQSDVAKFNNISPDNTGKIEFTLSIIGSYHYLSAFTITEQADVPVAFAPTAPVPTPAPAKQVYQGENIVEMGADAVSVYPNPFAGSFKVQLNNKTAGAFVLKLSATSGQTVFYKKINKASGTVVETINVNNLTPGTYILEIISVTTGNKTVHKVIKN